MAYYTTSQAPADPCPGNDIVNSILSGTSQGSLVTFEPPYANRIVGLRFARLDEANCDSPQNQPVTSPLAQYFDGLRSGDVINDSGLATFAYEKLGTVQVGDYVWINPAEADPHGLLIIGWGDIIDCPQAVNASDPNYRRTIHSFTMNRGAEPGRVPWVVDFTRAQSPVPRPFYCTAYLEPGFVNFGFHDWYFYTLPSVVTIPRGQAYVDRNWEWQAGQ